MTHIFLIEFLLLAGLLLVWIAYEYSTAKKLSEQSKNNQSKDALSKRKDSQATSSIKATEQTFKPDVKKTDDKI